MSLNILHISDLHFGPYFVPPVAESLREKLNELEAELIIASGDFTQRAKPGQFREAREYLDSLPKLPTVVVPGNHDVPLYRIGERIFEPYRYYKQYISPELDTVVRVEGAVIVALNSTAPLRAIVNGRIREWQLDLCEREFAKAAPGDLRIVVAHHHFAPAPDYEGGGVMPHAKRALDRFTALKVDMIFGGHLHRAYIGNSLDLYPGKDREHGIIVVQSGTSTSRRGRAREREKNTFNHIQVTDEIVRITHYMHFNDDGGFLPISRHIFPRVGRRYLNDAPPARQIERPIPRDTDLYAARGDD